VHETPQASKGHWERVARSGHWFASIPVGFATALLTGAQRVTRSSGQRLFSRGDASDGMYCILQGVVRVTAVTRSGQEALLVMLEAPHWFGEISLFDGEPRTHDAWAENNCELLHVPQEAVLSAVALYPQGWRDLGRLLAQRLRATFIAVEEMTLLPAMPRLAARLLSIAGGYGFWGNCSKRTVRVSQEQLGLMLSLSRQTVNGSLRELEALGAIRRGRCSIEITDIEKLRQARG